MALRGAWLALLVLPLGGALQAQAIKNEPPMRHFTEQEVAAIQMPALAFQETPAIVTDYEKYFYFYRPDTSFDAAYADITECDALARGVKYYAGGYEPYPGYYGATYGLAGGVIGGAIASVLVDTIFGSEQRRKMRRTNVRTCMHYKGYDRYGLARDQWKDFNFEEGNGPEKPDIRARDLLMQARVASGPKPQQEALKP